MIRRYPMLTAVAKTAWRRSASHYFYLPRDRPSAKLCGLANSSSPRAVPFVTQSRFFSKDGKHGNGSTGLSDFIPTKEWQTVKEGQILPPGLEIDVNVTTGEKRARLKMEIEEAATVVEESAREAAGGKDACKPAPPPPPPPRKKKGKRIGGMNKEEMERRLREAKAPSRRQQTNKQMKEAKASGKVVEPNRPRRTVEERAASTEPTVGSSKPASLPKSDGKSDEAKGLSPIKAFLAIPPIAVVSAFLYQKFVNKDDDPLETWAYNFEKYKSEYLGGPKSMTTTGGAMDDGASANEPKFETLEEYEAYKKKNPFRFDPKTHASRNAKKGQSDVVRDPNRPMTMSERLKQYELGKVDILKPIKVDKKEDEAKTASSGEETKKKELSDSSSLEEKPKQDDTTVLLKMR